MAAAVAVLAVLAGSGLAVASHARNRGLGKPFGHAVALRPDGPVRGVVVVLADRPGRHGPAMPLARALAARGLLVALVPARGYLAHIDPHQCQLPANAAERVARRLMRWSGEPVYHQPLLVGVGHAGDTLARLAVANALPQTVGGAVLVQGEWEGPMMAACGQQGPTPDQGFVLALAPGEDPRTVVDTVMARLPRPRPSFRDLPLVELPAPGSRRLVVFLSGDGGWRALDKGVSAGLRARGDSVLGWDSMRYFWTRRTPQRTAEDLAAVIEEYGRRWHADRVDLVGYSFGADAMPFLYNRLPPSDQARVDSITLMGLGHGASFEVSVGGWLGTPSSDDAPVAPELARIPPAKLLCVYGRQESDTLCPQLAAQGIRTLETGGGHHFDGDPDGLAGRVAAGFGPHSAAVRSAGAMGDD